MKLWFTYKNNLIDTNGGIYLTVDTFIEINNIITVSDNITLRKVNVTTYDLIKCTCLKS